MTNFVKSGDNLTLVAPYDVLSGGGFKVGNLFGVAAHTPQRVGLALRDAPDAGGKYQRRHGKHHEQRHRGKHLYFPLQGFTFVF